MATTEATGQAELTDGLGRLLFMLASVVLAAAAYIVLHPRRGALGNLVSRRSRLWRVRWAWFPWMVGAPLALACLAAAGFHFTASEIQDRIFTSGWLLVAALIVYGLALRWLLVANRKIALRRAIEDQAEAQAAKAQRRSGSGSGDAVPENLVVPKIGLASISTQTRTLLRVFVGVTTLVLLWTIWDDLLPALNILNEIQLWTRPEANPLDGTAYFVTLGDVALSLFALALTVIAARNLPGLVEVLFLSRLAVDSGTRYALITIARYVIVAVGVVIAISFLGVNWSKLQWIVAALGVGLGFGLQEIVANFVSGLIILFERPVRVGDTVTVGGVDGTISRLQIRATTITDWDNREILVPNKNFITDQVTNWTLTNPINRVVIPVGIAYASDTVKAQQVMLDAVRSAPVVLDEPTPTVFFMGFGDSSLNFEIRAFASSLEDRLKVIHEIHTAVEKALRREGIGIPFPQRDVHLYPAPGGDDQNE